MSLENEYWGYMDFAIKIHNWLISKEMVLMGLYNDETRDWFDCHCVDKKDVMRPYTVIDFEELMCSPTAMKELFAYGFIKAREVYLDKST